MSWLPFLINLVLGLLIVAGLPIAIWRMRLGRAAAISREIADRRALIEGRQSGNRNPPASKSVDASGKTPDVEI